MSEHNEPVTAFGASDMLRGEPTGSITPPQVATATWAEREPDLVAPKDDAIVLTITIPLGEDIIDQGFDRFVEIVHGLAEGVLAENHDIPVLTLGSLLPYLADFKAAVQVGTGGQPR